MALHKLTYPVYGASFDPHNDDFLFVGGGGGESRSGVPNKVTLLDTSSAMEPRGNELREIAHIDLAQDEDSVSSIAVAHADETEAIVFTGINSSQKEQDAGNNEHLRSIKVPYPQRMVAGAGTKTAVLPTPSALSKAALFATSTKTPKETYQRVIRLSPAIKGVEERLGAIATGLAPVGELILFNASSRTPSAADVVQKISLGANQEAADVDILPNGECQYRVVYCTDTNVYCLDVKLGSKERGSKESVRIFEGSKNDGTFRSMRLLTLNLVLLIRNFPGKKGAQFLIVRIPDVPKTGKIVYGLALPTGFNAATALDVATLPAITDSEKRQFLVAASGQNNTIVLYTLDYTSRPAQRLYLKQHTVYRNVHPAGITSLAFSKFAPTPSEVSTKPMRVKIASTSFGNTVAVTTLPLKPRPSPRKATYHILATPPQTSFTDTLRSFFLGAVIVAIISAILGAYAELTGAAKFQPLGIRNWAPGPVKELFGVPRAVGTPLASAPVIVDKMPPIEPAAAARAASRAAAKEASQASSAIDEVVTPIVESLNSIADEATETVLSPISAIEDVLQHIPTEAVGATVKGAVENGEEIANAAQEKIAQILKENQQSTDGAVVFRDLPHGVAVSTHEHEGHAEDAGAKKWEDLNDHQKHLWRRRLKQAGHWVEGEAETVLKGVFFGTIAGMVGAAVGG